MTKQCALCGSIKTEKWYSGPKCRTCYRIPKLKTGKLHIKRATPVSVYDKTYYNEYRKARLKQDPTYRKALSRKCRAWKLATHKQMPRNLSKENQIKILDLYDARPPGHHVDHIIPLRGKIVSGLHVHWNMQYLLAKENMKKSNKCPVL